jgi:hypothetical protein
MAQVQRQPRTHPQLTSFKYFKKLLPLFERVHDDGCARDRAHNRTLQDVTARGVLSRPVAPAPAVSAPCRRCPKRTAPGHDSRRPDGGQFSTAAGLCLHATSAACGEGMGNSTVCPGGGSVAAGFSFAPRPGGRLTGLGAARGVAGTGPAPPGALRLLLGGGGGPGEGLFRGAGSPGAGGDDGQAPGPQP